MMVSGDGWGWG